MVGGGGGGTPTWQWGGGDGCLVDRGERVVWVKEKKRMGKFGSII